MKTFKFYDMPVEIQNSLLDMPNLVIDEENKSSFVFKAIPGPDPEIGNAHIPVTRWLLTQGVRKAEEVLIEGISRWTD